MKKVLLIFEDFQESGQTETDLKKVGFDVLGINNLISLSDQILTFGPDAVISCGIQKIPSLMIGRELKKVNHYRGKSILILPNGARPAPSEIAKTRVDVLIEAPVLPFRLIEILAKLLSLDPAPLVEKFNKSKIQEHAAPLLPRINSETPPGLSDLIRVKGGGSSSGSNTSTAAGKNLIEDKERVAGYQKFVQGIKIDVQETSHSKVAIKERQEELKKGWDFQLLEQLDKLKRQFAEALFKKNN